MLNFFVCCCLSMQNSILNFLNCRNNGQGPKSLLEGFLLACIYLSLSLHQDPDLALLIDQWCSLCWFNWIFIIYNYWWWQSERFHIRWHCTITYGLYSFAVVKTYVTGLLYVKTVKCWPFQCEKFSLMWRIISLCLFKSTTGISDDTIGSILLLI